MQQTYRANLTAAEFPFLSELQGRTVIIPGFDQNYSRQASSPKNKDRDIGIPQMYYCHNVMPTDAGVTSLSFQQITAPASDIDSTFNEIFNLRDPAENVADFCNTTSGRCYVRLTVASGWIRTTDKAPAAGQVVTIAYVNGQTYIYFGGVGCFTYNFATNALDAVVLTSLTPANIQGICASSGYMIAWTSTTALWSSIVSPIDFTPSLITGAGGGGIQSLKAAITVCLPMNNGFIVYTKKNAVAAVYSGNSQFPFNYKEIIGAGGLAAFNLVSYDGNSTNHYAYTSNGLQEVSPANSTVMFPQLTDFIAGSKFEDYNELSGIFTVVDLVVPMKKKLTMISNRYLIFSYGVNQLTHALVYDFALSRWGKIKLNHVDCFEYSYPSSEVVETPRRSIGFLQADGSIIIAIIAYDTTGSNGTAIFGKYQLDRNHYIGMQEIHLESVKYGNTLNVKLMSSIDGTNTFITLPVLDPKSNGTVRRYGCRATGVNHSVALTGAFHLNSLILKFCDEGEVR
jgi:hypothetical protein